MRNMIASELLKMKRKMVIFLIFLGPFGVVALQAVNFGVRYDWLTQQYQDDLWKGLIQNVTMLAVPTLLLGITIITSMLANIEHQTNAWKQLLALPVSKLKVYTSKVLLSFSLLLFSSFLLCVGTIILGISLRFGLQIPFQFLLEMTFYPYLAALPVLALQIWLAITLKNQAIPLSIGILGALASNFAIRLPDWFPLKWPWLINEWNNPLYSALAGIVVGITLYCITAILFARKDVH